ncbi:exodeoxyribonuclease VII small subunit [Canibacter sp. lx-45]|uniref:exodeoxyribonuclease VII small subunit n=1 Tax=Canibacter zhuwentaonis TaxID=2837491 RepID=UPI001BDBD175|nr:exodeoxyribonuclease VII small subunit [Canibacter zhuwentaonis]MBT1035924.1 exodeoxyribonuclease VII small subunit [Canibacter zhuwentaonis]
MTTVNNNANLSSEQANNQLTDVANLSFEQARDRLISVVQQLEQGNVTLDKSLALWEEGEKLAQHCEDKLRRAKQQLEGANGGAGVSASGSDA